MLIDWFTVLAQVVNFLVLILILKRFLYRPILGAVQERERRIASRLEGAEQARKEALLRTEELGREREAFEKAKEQLLAESRKEVQQERDKLLEQARKEIATLRKGWLDGVEEEKEAFSRKLKIRVAEQVLRISRKVLQDLAGGNLETQLIETFLMKAGTSRNEWPEENAIEPDRLSVRTGLALTQDLQGSLEQGLKRLFHRVDRVDFSVEPELGFGIQLLAGDQKVEWNLARYMRGLEGEVLGSIKQTTGRVA